MRPCKWEQCLCCAFFASTSTIHKLPSQLFLQNATRLLLVNLCRNTGSILPSVKYGMEDPKQCEGVAQNATVRLDKGAAFTPVLLKQGDTITCVEISLNTGLLNAAASMNADVFELNERYILRQDLRDWALLPGDTLAAVKQLRYRNQLGVLALFEPGTTVAQASALLGTTIRKEGGPDQLLAKAFPEVGAQLATADPGASNFTGGVDADGTYTEPVGYDWMQSHNEGGDDDW